VIFSYQEWGLDVFDGLPRIVTFWISLPLDQVLEFAPIMSVGSNGLNFVLFFSFDYIWRGSGVVLAIFHSSDVGRKEAWKMGWMFH
jgi:hypothetical protein